MVAKMWAPAIVEATQSRRMPPWGAFDTEDCQPSRPWVDDQRLSDDELAVLSNWSALGAPEGDADNPVAGQPFVANQLGRIDYEGRAGAPVDVPAGQDSFICVVIDPNLTEETWIKGFEFVPDNEALVHHVVLFTDPTRASLDARTRQGHIHALAVLACQAQWPQHGHRAFSQRPFRKTMRCASRQARSS